MIFAQNFPIAVVLIMKKEMLEMLKKIIPLLLSAAMLATGCSDGAVTENASSETTLSEKSFLPSDEYVKKIGRTYEEENGTLWLAHSASGIEFTFTGTKASVSLAGDVNASLPSGKDGYARYAYYIDGKRAGEGMMDEAARVVEIYSSDSEKETTVKFLKISECANSTLAITGIDAESIGNIAPTEDKQLKIEFIGDSITCGYGVDDEDRNNHFKTDTEDATKAYAYKTAELLDADYSLVSYSGHGIISGYSGDGKIQSAQTVPPLYEKVGRSYSNSAGFNLKQFDWDFNTFVPDIIVVNLGTNDNSYVKNDEEKKEAYVQGYVDFLGQIRRCNPDAQIVCTLGIMGAELYPSVEEAVKRYTESSGDSKVTAMPFEVQSPDDGYAADWHPTEATHTKAAERLAEYLKTLI